MAWKTLKILALLSLFSLLLLADKKSDAGPGSFVGDVADAVENAPIPYAAVFIHPSGHRESWRVDLATDGKFETSLQPGLYDVFVAASGFAPFCKVVKILPQETTSLSVRLRADSEHLTDSLGR